MPKHAAPQVGPYLMPVYYLTDDTLTAYPLALLLEGPDPDNGIPCAYGVKLIESTNPTERCTECNGPAVAVMQYDQSGGGNPVYQDPFCITCLVGGDHYGLVPTCYLMPVPFD